MDDLWEGFVDCDEIYRSYWGEMQDKRRGFEE